MYKNGELGSVERLPNNLIRLKGSRWWWWRTNK
jgi:hypothetical protein